MWELAICEAREELARVFTDSSMKLKEVVEEVRKRQKILGPDTVRFAWVKTHVGTQGDEKAKQMAKSRAELGDGGEGMEKVHSHGGGFEAGGEEEEGRGEKGKGVGQSRGMMAGTR